MYASTPKATSVPMAPVVAVQAGSDGAFSVTIRPGKYVLVASSPLYQGGRRSCYGEGEVTVTADHNVVANVYCEEM
ncbi:MAG: hypothetical protein ACXVPR_05325 [Actinomycetota bacterium]